MMYRIFPVILFLFLSIRILASGDNSNVKIFDNKIRYANSIELFKRDIGAVVADMGTSFIGTPYVEKSLDKTNQESLIVNLSGFDCTTFVESMLAFARCITENRLDYKDYTAELQNIRYRNGRIYSYASRLHYFSDWILDNCSKKIIRDVTEEIGGTAIKFELNFMATHSQLYPQLVNRKDLVDSMVCAERRISSAKFYEIPKSEIPKLERKINTGDIIAITTDIKGLDISHVGIAIKSKNDRIYFLHASQSGKKVMISEVPLSEYLGKHPHQRGIIVLRPLGVL